MTPEPLAHATPLAPLRLHPWSAPLAAEHFGVGPDRLTFVHGFTQTGRTWLQVATRFAREHDVLLVDVPGHGASASVRADLRRAADLLGQTAGTSIYVGYSLGGRICLHLALAYPHLVTRLVLLSATAGIADDAERRARRAADEALAASIEADGIDAFLARWLAQPLFAGFEPTDADRAERRRNTAEGLARSLRMSGTGTQDPLWSRLQELQMPVLVLAGERDTKFVDLGEQLAAGIPRATFATIPGAGHAAHLEQPTVTASLIAGFLATATD